MASAVAVEGVKISDISLIIPRVQKSTRDTKFQVRIKFKGAETETRAATVKKSPASNEHRLIWGESFCFAGDTTNSVITLKVHRTQRFKFSTQLVGRFEEKVADLFRLRNDSEFCNFDIDDGNGQLSFKIELRSGILSDIVLDASKASTHISTGHLISSVHDTLVNQGNIWSPFLSQFQVFMTAVDGIAGIHPYVQLAWSILSVLPKMVITYKDRNDSVKELCEKLEEVYKFITDAERLPQLDETANIVLLLLVRQTIECAYFIREYSTGHLVERIWKGSSIDGMIKDFINKFDHLKKVMTEFVTLDTSIITLRVSRTVSEIRNLHLLDDMPYARDAGFIPKKRCFPGTRQRLIKEILEWVNFDASEKIFVLSGQAGTGKSAIAHTIAEIFQEQNRLGSLFCFNRSYRDRTDNLFSTITRDLADGDTLWRQSLVECIDKTAIRRSTDMETQFNELIIKPSRDIPTIGPVVIVIDALDESGDPTERRLLLDILFNQLSKFPINYRFILTTRPEQDIELHCQGPAVVYKRMGDIPEKETLLDVQSYISHRLKEEAGLLDSIQKDWREILAKRAEGLFQWADTACRTIDSFRHPPLVKAAWDACTSGPSTSLYELYYNIISAQRECQYPKFIDDFKLIVSAIITAREPLTVDALNNLFQNIHVKTILSPFGSLLIGVHDELTPIRPLHTSLLDFFHARMLDATHENKYYVDTADESLFTIGCLELMNHTLRFNICGLETSHLRNRDVPNFVKRVGEAIPLHLSYACRFWGFHLRNSGEIKDFILVQLRILMQDKLLYWFEALGLLGEVERGCVAMRIMQIWCQDIDTELADQAADARQFSLDNGDVIEKSTPHLYISALPFTPSDSFISRQFSPMYPRLFKIKGGQQFDPALKTGLVKKNPSSIASSIVFSPQGRYIATGFSNGEFWFWDDEFGEILYQWKAGTKNIWNCIGDIVFPPDGQLVYNCFQNGHIRTWDVKTKKTIDDSYRDILDSESECYWCTVSSDGHYIIFVIYWETNDDRTLLLCDRTSRRKLMQFDAGFSSYPVFTPKGDMLAFVNRSRDVCLWDIRRQALIHSWKTRCSCQLALSDKQMMFSPDNSIEVWDIHALAMICKIETTLKQEYSIRFAGDRHLLAYSYKTYVIWDIPAGEMIVESSLDDQIVTCATSFGSKYVAFGVSDRTVHVRPLGTPIWRKLPDILEERFLIGLWVRGRYLVQVHGCSPYSKDIFLLVSDTTTVNSIVFEARRSCLSEMPVAVSSRNDHVYVAFADSCDLCVWNDTEGEFILDKSTDIILLEYSPLGDRLISAHRSGVIKIWDIDTRALIGGPHTVPGCVYAIAFSATGKNFVVAYGKRMTLKYDTEESEVTFIEVQDGQSGHVLRGPFKSVNNGELQFYDVVQLSADETKVIWMPTESNIEILDAVTSESKLLNRRVDHPWYTPVYQLSQNKRCVGWRLGDKTRVEPWDVDSPVLLHQLLLSDPLREFFSDDTAARITILYCMDNKSYIDLWDTSTGKTVRQGIQIYSMDRQLLSLHGNHLVVSNRRIPKILNLDVHLIMSSFYEHHRNHSQFGMFPIDNSEARREIQTLIRLTSMDEDTLGYALIAWDKALFSMGAEISEDGWILGPHDELLVWIPERRRNSLWRPCMTHIGSKDFTKLNFDKFVHGTRWMECKGDL